MSQENFTSAASPGDPSSERPTRARLVVVAFMIVLAIITYIDRVCISQAAGQIRADLKLSDSQMGWVFSAFTIMYALFEIPGGWMGDRYGPRKVLMKVVVLWSVFTAASGWAWNFASMVVCRALFGVGEAGCFPNITKIFTIWMPRRERSSAQGILWLSARWGGAFTPVLVAWILTLTNWRTAFVLFGLLGIVWAFFFYRWFRDRPAEHPSVNKAELALLDDAEGNAPGHAVMPWKALFSNRSVWLLWLQYFCLSWGWYFYITWLPTYLRDARGLSIGTGALVAGLPLFFGGVGCFAGGWAARVLSEKWRDVRRARRVVACTGLLGAGALLVIAARASDPTLAIGSLALASFSNDLAMAPDWSACMDVGGRFAGALSGSMNMIGNLGGAAGAIVVGYILDITHAGGVPSLEGWNLVFMLSGGLYGIGAVAWYFIDSTTPMAGADTPAVL